MFLALGQMSCDTVLCDVNVLFCFLLIQIRLHAVFWKTSNINSTMMRSVANRMEILDMRQISSITANVENSNYLS